jgi:hypothetical protein
MYFWQITQCYYLTSLCLADNQLTFEPITDCLLYYKEFMMTTNTITNKTVFAATMTSFVLFSFSANAASEIIINQPATGSTTVVEQYSDGNTATITATPNGISMRNGMPYSVTQVTNVPRYTVSQGSSTVVARGPITSQVTQQIGNTPMTTVTTPIHTAAQVMTPVTTAAVVNNQIVTSPVVTSQTVTTLDTLQLNPTFSTPGVVNAHTKVMKILKDSSGRDVAVPANSIKPGDIIEYQTTYVNNSNQPINDVNAMVALPSGVRVVSLNSPLPTLATTGGDSYQTIQQVGNTVTVQENYSALKWNLANLPANTPQTVVIRAKVQ